MTREEVRVYSEHDKRIKVRLLWSLVQKKIVSMEEAADECDMTTEGFIEKAKEICGELPR